MIGHFLNLNTLKIFLHSLLSSTASDEKVVVQGIPLLPIFKKYFFPCCFLLFALSLSFLTVPCYACLYCLIFMIHIVFLSVFVTKHKFMCSILQFSSVAQSCQTLCDPMNCSMPGLPVHHQLPEFTQTHVHRVGDAIQPSHPLSSPSPPTPNPSQHQSLFQ